MNEEYLQKLQTYQISKARSITSKKLAATDWYVTRNVEREIEIPADIAAERATAIEKFNTFKNGLYMFSQRHLFCI